MTPNANTTSSDRNNIPETREVELSHMFLHCRSIFYCSNNHSITIRPASYQFISIFNLASMYLWVFLNMGQPRSIFRFFCLFKQTIQFLQQINVKNVNPVNGAWIRTYDLQNISLLPQPLENNDPR